MAGVLASGQMCKQFAGLKVSSPSSSLRPCRRLAFSSPQRRCRLAVTARQAEVGVGMFGTKAGMTQIFTPEGLALPATVIAFEKGNMVAQVKTVATDGYDAVQVHICWQRNLLACGSLLAFGLIPCWRGCQYDSLVVTEVVAILQLQSQSFLQAPRSSLSLTTPAHACAPARRSDTASKSSNQKGTTTRSRGTRSLRQKSGTSTSRASSRP